MAFCPRYKLKKLANSCRDGPQYSEIRKWATPTLCDNIRNVIESNRSVHQHKVERWHAAQRCVNALPTGVLQFSLCFFSCLSHPGKLVAIGIGVSITTEIRCAKPCAAVCTRRRLELAELRVFALSVSLFCRRACIMSMISAGMRLCHVLMNSKAQRNHQRKHEQ